MRYRTDRARRRGVMAPLAALFLVFFFGMVAFGVDVGWIVLARTDLQSSADAAALAGAHPLMDAYVQYQLTTDATTKNTILTNAVTSAKTYAKDYASYNAAGNASSLVLNDADIECGYMDASNNYTPGPPYNNFPNTVKVTLKLDGASNSSLGLYFGPVFGKSSLNVTATASATIYSGVVTSFSNTGLNTGMMPVTYDQKLWYDFVATGKDPAGIARVDASGVPELPVYPEPANKYKGNFGWLSLDDSHASANDLRTWINSGMSSSDIQALIAGRVIPLDNGIDAWDWTGTTGFKSSDVQELNNHVGQTYTLPLFKPLNNGNNYTNSNSYQAGSGNGSHLAYNIVEFVGVKIMPPDDYNREILIRPAAVIDPNAVFKSGTLNPAGSSGSTLITTFSPPKLTR